MSNLPAIKPCPFCGHSASIEEIGASRYAVGCDNEEAADCIGYQSLTTFYRKVDAIAAWNRRVVLPDQSLVTAETAAAMAAMHERGKTPAQRAIERNLADIARRHREAYEREAAPHIEALARLEALRPPPPFLVLQPFDDPEEKP